MIWKVISIFFMIIGSALFFIEVLKIRKHTFIDGKVIDYLVVDDSDGETYKPRVEYHDNGNQTKIFIPLVSSSSKMFAVGDTIKLLFNDTDNEVIGVVHLVHRFLIPFIVFVVGVSFYLFSLEYTIQVKIFEWIHNF